MKLKLLKFALPGICFIFFGSLSIAQVSPPGVDDIPQFYDTTYVKSGVYAFTDQDVFRPKFNEDRNYTMGIQIGAYGDWTNRKKLIIPYLRDRIDQYLGLDSLHQLNSAINRPTIFFYGSGYTPLAIDSVNPIIGDRPYGSLVGIGSSMTSVKELTGPGNPHPWALTTSFHLAVLGLNVGREAQSYIHRNHWFGSERPIPVGWHNQISQGGEPTLLYQVLTRRSLYQKQYFSPFRDKQMNRLQVNATFEGMAGYYTNVAAGVEARFGMFSNPFWDINTNAGSGMNQGASQTGREALDGLEWYFFGALRGRLVGYNALLQGQFRKSVYTLNATQIERLIEEYELGIGVKIRHVHILWTIIAGRTPEYRTAFARPHIWGSFQIRYNFQKMKVTPIEL